jgi:site-specific recombinase XerD
MLAELELRGMSAATKRSYLTCCRVFVAYFMKSPERLGATEIKEFLLHLMRERRVGPSAVRVYVSAIAFLYRAVLRRPELVDDLPRPRVPRKLPEVPSRDEMEAMLRVVRSLKYRNRTAQDVGSGRARTPAVGQQVVDLGGRMILDA